MKKRLNPLFLRSLQLRKELTSAERNLWLELRNRHLGGYKFRRQHRIANFIVDFYCAEARLVIEIDGEIHAQQRYADTMRSRDLNALGYKVVRSSNWQVIDEIEKVKARILQVCRNV